MDIDAKITTFMAEYAGYIINRLDVEKDGKAAYERMKGKPAMVCICVEVKARSAELLLATEVEFNDEDDCERRSWVGAAG